MLYIMTVCLFLLLTLPLLKGSWHKINLANLIDTSLLSKENCALIEGVSGPSASMTVRGSSSSSEEVMAMLLLLLFVWLPIATIKENLEVKKLYPEQMHCLEVRGRMLQLQN